jgi:hypothetical protein
MLVGLENLLTFHLQEREKLRAELARLDGSSYFSAQNSAGVVLV